MFIFFCDFGVLYYISLWVSPINFKSRSIIQHNFRPYFTAHIIYWPEFFFSSITTVQIKCDFWHISQITHSRTITRWHSFESGTGNYSLFEPTGWQLPAKLTYSQFVGYGVLCSLVCFFFCSLVRSRVLSVFWGTMSRAKCGRHRTHTAGTEAAGRPSAISTVFCSPVGGWCDGLSVLDSSLCRSGAPAEF